MSANQRSRNWCFTLNNYTVADLHEFQDWNYTYIIVGKEVGDEKKTPHLQGYVEFANAHTGAAMRQGFGGRGHWEPRRGTAPQASDYCKKDGSFVELGTMGNQGKRTDLDAIGEAIMSGQPLDEVAADHPGTYIKYHKGMDALMRRRYTVRNEAPRVIWLWGASGTGKTREAVEACESYYIKDGTQWWDAYDQQEAIIIDDFEPCKWPYRDLLRLLDRYPYQGQVKGGYVAVNSPVIYITCEHPPSLHWTGNELAQVTRRLTEIREVTGYVPRHEAHSPMTEPVQEEQTERQTHHPLPDFAEDMEEPEYDPSNDWDGGSIDENHDGPNEGSDDE